MPLALVLLLKSKCIKVTVLRVCSIPHLEVRHPCRTSDAQKTTGRPCKFYVTNIMNIIFIVRQIQTRQIFVRAFKQERNKYSVCDKHQLNATASLFHLYCLCLVLLGW